MSRRPFATKLVHLGFHKDVSPGLGRDPLIYTKVVRNDRTELRIVDVQLWRDGGHRASHILNGCMDTLPTGFTDIPSMVLAIKVESSRTDHPRELRRRFSK